MKTELQSLTLLVLFAGGVQAFDLEQSADLSATFTAFTHPTVSGLPADMQSPEYQLNGNVSAFWNVLVFPSDTTQLNIRYGLSANSELDQAGSANQETTTAMYRVDDLPAQIDLQYQQNLDQFSATWYSPFGDYTLGRQPISFGQARFYSPIDVIQPAAVFATDRSYRPGVDAFRGTWQLGAVSELEAGYVFGQDTVAFSRLKAYLLNSDWELIALRINDDHWIGSLGTSTGFGAVGFWQETAVLTDTEDADVRATLGMDYTFFDDLYVMAELHYNGLGGDNATAMSQSFYQLGAVVPTGQWYGSAQASYPLNIVTQLSGGVSANLDDGSVLLNSSLSYNASDSLSVNVSALLPVVKEHSLDYEYGAYPTVIEVDLDWVF